MSITQGLKRAMQINRRGTATLFGERRPFWAGHERQVN
jgi:hypothetical protein